MGWEKQYQYFIGKKKVYMPPSEAKQYGYERASKYPKSTKYGRQRRRIREDGIKEVIQKLRNTFGKKYDYDIFKKAETDVSKALNEKPIPKKSILSQLNHRQQQSILQKQKKREFER